MTFQIFTFKHTEILPYVEALVDMRLNAFSEFPYLYIGNREDELSYAKEYALSPQGILVVAFKNDRLAGSSGIPLSSPHSSLKPWLARFRAKDIEVESAYYIGELMIAPAFQKQKCCSLIITHFIEAVKAMKFSHIIGLTCIREKNHPLSPSPYFGSESIWTKIGAEQINLILSVKWTTRQEDGSSKTEKNKLSCWIKNL